MGETERLSFRWGIPELDHGNVVIPEPIYRFHGELDVKGNAFVFIVHLAAFKYESAGSVACPSYQTLATRMGLTRRAVIKIASGLEDDGWVQIHRRGTETSEFSFAPFAQACWDRYRQAASEPEFTSKASASELQFTSASEPEFTPLVNQSSPEEQEEKNKKTKNSSTRKRCVRKPIMTLLTETYRQLREVEPKGGEWTRIQREFKNMIFDGNHQHDIIAVMKWCAEQEFTWSMHTVRKWLPDQRAGKLGRNGDGDKAGLLEELRRLKKRLPFIDEGIAEFAEIRRQRAAMEMGLDDVEEQDLKNLREERDILRKAVAIFSRAQR